MWPRVFQRVYNFLRRRCIQPADAEDLASEGTLRAVERAQTQTFVDDRHRENWMYVVARNRAIDLLRREGRFQPESLVGDPIVVPPGEPSGWEEVVRQCGARLTTRQRLLLAKRYRRGLTWEELANLLLPPDDRTPAGRIAAIRREWLEALRELRRGLEGEGLDPDSW